jgi:HD-like signal output (HDOD) protein
MIDTHRMTKEEADECMQHFLLHDMADLCLSEGFEPTMEQLIAIINAKVDNLEPI